MDHQNLIQGHPTLYIKQNEGLAYVIIIKGCGSSSEAFRNAIIVPWTNLIFGSILTCCARDPPYKNFIVTATE
jgi:hypothetical protein